jgi:hypothetical protein
MTTLEQRAHQAMTTRTAQAPGHWDKATNSRCPACGVPTIRGLDAPVAAFTAVADPNPVDRAGELTALLAGRRTYRLWTRPRPTLRVRDHWQISGHPADTVPVVAQHRCGSPLGTTPTPKPKETTHDRAPF